MGNETKKLQIIDLQGLLMRKMDFVPISLFLHFANAIILKSKKTTQVNLVVFIFKLCACLRRKRGSLRASQQEILSKHRNSSTLCVFSFLFSVIYENKFLTFLKTKKLTTFVVSFFLRRKRDSNPRTCNSQQFSRLPHSTTLPFLQSRQSNN